MTSVLYSASCWVHVSMQKASDWMDGAVFILKWHKWVPSLLNQGGSLTRSKALGKPVTSSCGKGVTSLGDFRGKASLYS